MGSVKDLQIIHAAKPDKLGIGRFYFSDRYSVFDWGEMPDLITNKGKALAMIGAYFFEKLEEMGIATHYRGLVLNGKVKRLSALDRPSDIMEVALVQLSEPRLDIPAHRLDAQIGAYRQQLRAPPLGAGADDGPGLGFGQVRGSVGAGHPSVARVLALADGAQLETLR